MRCLKIEVELKKTLFMITFHPTYDLIIIKHKYNFNIVLFLLLIL